MGYERNHAIIVSSHFEKDITEALAKAEEIFAIRPWPMHGRPLMMVSPILQGVVNMCFTFLVGPDGSKEGWAESDEGDKRRAEFIEWLETKRYDDGSTSLAYVEVQFADEMHRTEIVHHSDEGHVHRCGHRIDRPPTDMPPEKSLPCGLAEGHSGPHYFGTPRGHPWWGDNGD